MTSHNTSTTGILDNNPYSEENRNKIDDRHQSHESKTVEDKTDINKNSNSQIKIKNKFHRSTDIEQKTRISNKNFNEIIENPEEAVKISNNTNKIKLQFQQQPATKNNDVHNILHGNKLQLANNAENNNKFQTQTQILRSSNNSKNSICSAKHVTHFSALLKPVLSIPAKKQISKPNYQIPAVDFDENTTEDFTSAIFLGCGILFIFVPKN